MTWLATAASVLLIVALLAVAGQHFRYQRTRRDIVADRQTLFHSPSVFHVATVVALAPGQELLSGIREFVHSIEAAGGAVVYAGKIAVNAMQSNQIPQEEWDAFVLAQFPSREAYDDAAANPDYQSTRSGFAHSYALGLKRSPALNLALPIVLLAKRTVDVITRAPSGYPFRRADASQAPPEMRARRDALVRGLEANREYGSSACVVLNFIRHGSPEQRAANSGYGSAMLSLMAEMGNGPTHIGRAVTLEGDAHFDEVAIVYYPGVDYFADMVQSEFFTGIVGGKQLGDTLSSPTVPLLPHL